MHKGRPIGYIAGKIGRDSSSICHKLKRNAHHGRLGHVLPKKRADERRRRCRAKRRLSDPALTQKVRLLIMDRHWSLEEIDDISGSRVAAGAPLSLPTTLQAGP